MRLLWQYVATVIFLPVGRHWQSRASVYHQESSTAWEERKEGELYNSCSSINILVHFASERTPLVGVKRSHALYTQPCV